MPPLATSKSPICSELAPVKAPFAWPKSSDSMSVSEIAAQLTGRNVSPARRLVAWTRRATTSLPVPVSLKDEDGGIERGEAGDLVADFADGGRFADEGGRFDRPRGGDSGGDGGPGWVALRQAEEPGEFGGGELCGEAEAVFDVFGDGRAYCRLSAKTQAAAWDSLFSSR